MTKVPFPDSGYIMGRWYRVGWDKPYQVNVSRISGNGKQISSCFSIWSQTSFEDAEQQAMRELQNLLAAEQVPAKDAVTGQTITRFKEWCDYPE